MNGDKSPSAPLANPHDSGLRAQELEYQLTEVLGCLEEYISMPCTSLLVRLKIAGTRAKLVLAKEGVM